MPSELKKRWILKEVDEELVSVHCHSLKISPLLSRMLVLRGLIHPDDAKRYMSSSLRSDLPSPFLMADMEVAVGRLVHAIGHNELICVWGDYDVDGTTGASVLVAFLREIGVEAMYHVPHRIEEGYGLNLAGIRRLKDYGVGLVVSVDCGISNLSEIEEAKNIGLDVIVVDHHQPPEQLPRAIAVLNPHRRDCPFPDKGLCGAGLAFYLIIGLRARLRERGFFSGSEHPDLRRYLDIVTLATIADMVPLKGVNRTLARRGLEELGNSTRPGVVALKRVAGIAPGQISAGQVGFQLGPRINAAGRIHDGMKVVELLTTVSSEIALRIAEELDQHNRERRALEAEILEQALAQASAYSTDRYSFVLGREGWHPGVLGIVASRVVERYHRPTVVLSFTAGAGKGSARSIRGFHIVEGFRRCAHLLEKFGGHEYAGGLTIKEQHYPLFVESFENVAREALTPEHLLPFLEIDARLELSEIGPSLMRDIEMLKPFGIGNPEPLFMSERVELCDRKAFSTGTRFRFRQGGRFIGGVAFGIGEDFPTTAGSRVDVVYRLSESEWNGIPLLELKIVDARPATDQ
jgi:single-stranded-DNA-specific exonuclease